MKSGELHYNSGLDYLAFVARLQPLLADLRMTRVRLRPRFPSNFIPFSAQLNAKDQSNLKKFAELGWARVIAPNQLTGGYQFVSEQKCAEAILDHDRARGHVDISITQAIHFYSVAADYRVELTDGDGNVSMPKKRREWKALSFAVVMLGFSDHTGQEKIASRLGFSRKHVNQTAVNSSFLSIQHRFANLGSAMSLGFKSLEHFKGSADILRGIFTCADGSMRRQLPNRYSLKGKVRIEFKQRSYRSANTKLNRQYFAGTNRDSLPNAKRVAMARLGKKQKRSKMIEHGVRAKDRRRLLNIEKRTGIVYGTRSIPFRAMILPKVPPGSSLDIENLGKIEAAGLERFATDGILPDNSVRYVSGDAVQGYLKGPNGRSTVTLIGKPAAQTRFRYLPASLLRQVRFLQTWGLKCEVDRESGFLESPMSVNRGTVRQVRGRSLARLNHSLDGVLTRVHVIYPNKVLDLPGQANHEDAWMAELKRADQWFDWQSRFFKPSRPSSKKSQDEKEGAVTFM